MALGDVAWVHVHKEAIRAAIWHLTDQMGNDPQG